MPGELLDDDGRRVVARRVEQHGARGVGRVVLSSAAIPVAPTRDGKLEVDDARAVDVVGDGHEAVDEAPGAEVTEHAFAGADVEHDAVGHGGIDAGDGDRAPDGLVGEQAHGVLGERALGRQVAVCVRSVTESHAEQREVGDERLLVDAADRVRNDDHRATHERKIRS